MLAAVGSMIQRTFESWDDAGIFGGLALEVIEVLKTKTE